MADAHAVSRVKRCASEPSLHEEKRARACWWPAPPPSRSHEELPAGHRSCTPHLPPPPPPPPQLQPPAQADPRDLLQAALDQICELQRSLQSPQHDAHASDYEADDDSDGDGDGGQSDSGDEGERPWDRQVVLAGFELCSREALRFLVEEERLGAAHPAVRTLSAHLSARSRQLDCRQVLADYLRGRDPSCLS